MPSPEVLVVGAGPAGLAAGIHLARAGIPHLLLERTRPGGLLHAAGLVECYPGFPRGIQGPRLARAMQRQALALGVRIEAAAAVDARIEAGAFALRVGGSWLRAPCLVLCCGTRPRPVAGLPVEGDLAGRLHASTASLPRRLAGRRVLVSGGGDAAFDSALQLRARGAEVGLVLRGPPRALPVLVERVRRGGLPVLQGWQLDGVRRCGPRLELSLRGPAGEERRAEVDHLLCCHGREPEDGLWRALAPGEVPQDVPTAREGLFLAGDLLRGRCRYAAVAAGDGLRAARLAEAWLRR